MSRNLSLKLEFLTRVEGHGHIVIDMQQGILRKAELQIIETPRFFEALLKGRSIFEAQHISSRICGICACGHSLASIQAAENALGFSPSEQTLKLRELLLLIEHLDSHLLHIYMLVAPDLLGAKSFVAMLKNHAPAVRRTLRMKKACNDICQILVGRHVHPISCVIGGFTKLPENSQLELIQDLLLQISAEMPAALELVSEFEFPEFYRETEYVALVNDTDEYPLLNGDVGSSDGIRSNKEAYRSLTNEFMVPHSTAKHARLSRNSYAVGALARYNLNAAKLHPAAQKVARQLGLSWPCHNPFLNSCAQLVECVHCTEKALEVVAQLLRKGLDRQETVLIGPHGTRDITVQAGRGIGAIEVPRGLLFHDYTIDERGTIQQANCVIPTGQNLQNIEDDMHQLVPEIIEQSDAEIRLTLEMLVRAYDPCISCSTHFLEIDFIRHRDR